MRFTIAKNGDKWQLIDEAGEVVAEFGSKAEAISEFDRRTDFAQIAEDSRGGRFRISWLEGEETRDSGSWKRVIDAGATRFERNPIPYMMLTENSAFGGHSGAVLAGVIDTMRREGENRIVCEGNFDGGSEDGQESERLVRDGILTTVSPDYGDETWDEEVIAEDEDGWPTEVLAHMTDALLMGVTQTPFQALDSATIEIIDSNAAVEETPAADTEETEETDTAEEAVAASAFVTPPAAWFEDPKFSEPTPITIAEDGRIYGHAAQWGVCHIGIQGKCIEAPSSPSDYAYFLRQGPVKPEGCDCSIPTGLITMDTGHADRSASYTATMSHYDNTGTQVADVVVGEDIHGIWVSGSLRPELDDNKRRALMAASLSGDWRKVGGSLELVGLLAVNVPGFPVTKPRAVVASGEVQSLVAAGAPVMAKLKEAKNDPTRTKLDDLDRRLRNVERVSARLRPVAARMIAASVEPPDAQAS